MSGKDSIRYFAAFMQDLIAVLRNLDDAGMNWYVAEFEAAMSPREDSLLLLWALARVWGDMSVAFFAENPAELMRGPAAMAREYWATREALGRTITEVAGEILDEALQGAATPEAEIPEKLRAFPLAESPASAGAAHSSAKVLLQVHADSAAEKFGPGLPTTEAVLFAIDDVCKGTVAVAGHSRAAEFLKDPQALVRGTMALVVRRLTWAIRA